MDVLASAGGCFAGAATLITCFARSGRTEEHPHEWLYMALAYGRKDLVVKGDPDINWNDAHPHFGPPLLAIGGKGIQLEVESAFQEADPYYGFSPESKEFIKDLQALFEVALKRGADPSLRCPLSCGGCVHFTVRGGGSVIYDMKEAVAGRSALSLWSAFSQRAKELDSSKSEQLPLASSFFDGILSLLLHVIPKHRGIVPKRQPRQESLCMTEVPEATTGLWQKVMQDESCDVVLQCTDGEVLVHSAVIGSSSEVLAAMLRWPSSSVTSDEAQLCRTRRRVELQDRSEAIEAWKLLVYTGLPPHEGLSTTLLVEVLDISHRWQDHLLECGLLTAALAKRVVDGESCACVLEAALFRDLQDLRSECLAFARRSREMRRDWERGRFSGDVAEHLSSIFGVTRRGASNKMVPVRRWDL